MIKKAIILSGLLLLQPGCTLRGLILSYGDYAASWYVNQYVSLNKAQKNRLNRYLSRYWDELRCLNTKPLVTDLKSLERRLSARHLDGADAEWINARVAYWRVQIPGPALDFIAGLLKSLDQKQWNSLRKKLMEQQEEKEQRHASFQQEEKQERNEKLLSRLRDLYGDLSAGQEKEILRIRHDGSLRYGRYLKQRRTAVNEFLGLRGQNMTTASIREKLRIWLKQPELMRPESQRAEYFQIREGWARQWTGIHNLMSKVQKQHLSGEISDLASDLSASAPDQEDCQEFHEQKSREPVRS